MGHNTTLKQGKPMNPGKGFKKKAGKKKAKKPKALSKPTLIKKLDDVYSKYIRTKYATSTGYTRCVTCGILLRVWWFDGHGKKRWSKGCENGHFVKREVYPLRWDERNTAPQCTHCNHFLSGNYKQYTVYILDMYGRDTLDELLRIEAEYKGQGQKAYTIGDIRELLEYWENQYKELEEG